LTDLCVFDHYAMMFDVDDQKIGKWVRLTLIVRYLCLPKHSSVYQLALSGTCIVVDFHHPLVPILV
jgi:hypothetical protein